MGERKVLNKYYPPDFDPALLPRGKRGNKDDQMKVRMMLPMSIRCSTCGNYMYKGTKFNTRKEDVHSEKYLDQIMVFRFYFRCSKCGAEMSMKTDPKNSDYVMEQGATRNHEPWREKDRAVGEALAARAAEEEGNAMKALENRTLDSKREMDIMAALDELQTLNKRQARVDTEAALAALHRSAAKDEDDEVVLEEEDEAAVRAWVEQRRSFVKRLPDSAAPDRPGVSATGADRKADGMAASSSATAAQAAAPPKPSVAVSSNIGFGKAPLGAVVRKRKAEAPPIAAAVEVKKQEPAAVKKEETEPVPVGTGAANGEADSNDGTPEGLAGLLGGYGSSGSDSPPNKAE